MRAFKSACLKTGGLLKAPPPVEFHAGLLQVVFVAAHGA